MEYAALVKLYEIYTVWILLAGHLQSTTYGYGEKNCGDPGQARPCEKGAITASGEEFDPAIPSAAIAVPADMRMKAHDIYVSMAEGPCVKVRLNDKSNERWIGERGFDFSPAAVELLTGQPAVATWSGKVSLCTKEEE